MSPNAPAKLLLAGVKLRLQAGSAHTMIMVWAQAPRILLNIRRAAHHLHKRLV
jgi:hypothetical protein